MGKFLMDSNAVIYFLSGNLPNVAEVIIENKISVNEIAISDITKMEILGYNFTNLARHSVPSPHARFWFVTKNAPSAGF
jgi:hypothetical protein